MLYESNAGWNGAGGQELLPEEPRHFGADAYAFTDGHVGFSMRRRTDASRPEWVWTNEPLDANAMQWPPEPQQQQGRPTARGAPQQ